MKLLDLLKSLNSGSTADPDATALAAQVSPPEQSPPEQQRDELVDELSIILSLLDAAPVADNPAETQSATTSSPLTLEQKTEQKNAEQQELLNLAEIFEEALEANTDVEENAAPLLFMPAETPAPHQHHQIKSALDNRKQLVQSLLEEVLPALEKALDERLQQLDAATLQQLERAVTKNFAHRNNRGDHA